MLSLLFADVALSMGSEDFLLPIGIRPPIARVIALVETILVSSVVILGLVDYGRAKPKVLNLSPRWDIHIVIPGYFILSILPAAIGLIIVLLGLAEWGLSLICFSQLSIAGFVIIGFTRKRGEVPQRKKAKEK